MVEALKDSWVLFDDRSALSPEAQFSVNLKRIKAISTKWSLNKKAQNIKDLVDIEFELKRFHDSHSSGLLSMVDKDLLIEIESRKHAILIFWEKEARQKSRALWLCCGDDNTPFFHKFATHRK